MLPPIFELRRLQPDARLGGEARKTSLRVTTCSVVVVPCQARQWARLGCSCNLSRSRVLVGGSPIYDSVIGALPSPKEMSPWGPNLNGLESTNVDSLRLELVRSYLGSAQCSRGRWKRLPRNVQRKAERRCRASSRMEEDTLDCWNRVGHGTAFGRIEGERNAHHE